MNPNTEPETKSHKYYQTPKFDLWLKYFLDKDNPETYLNGTKSALLAYTYDPHTQYGLAALTGSKNIRKYKELAMIYGSEIGLTLTAMIDIAKKQMDTCQSEASRLQWWDRLIKILGYTPTPDEVKIEGSLTLSEAAKVEFDRFR